MQCFGNSISFNGGAPGDACKIGYTECTGGSICINNRCECFPNKISIDGQCTVTPHHYQAVFMNKICNNNSICTDGSICVQGICICPNGMYISMGKLVCKPISVIAANPINQC
ncbi:unnamed protein product [Thelazia callipaeda]|uniref:EB domain-containing protein n=1 Tax=Thelazia callipaeda TaxID=103827 RepID=A0A0N5CNX9_THECL|nr:unnamed protein product [Thelazia callipaeda]